jgi:hypothetical protein
LRPIYLKATSTAIKGVKVTTKLQIEPFKT